MSSLTVLKTFFTGRRSAKSARRESLRHRLSVESLEKRQVMAGNVVAFAMEANLLTGGNHQENQVVLTQVMDNVDVAQDHNGTNQAHLRASKQGLNVNLKSGRVSINVMSELGTNVGINPQPLPPRVINAPGRINLGAEVGINPQPLPPRVITSPGRINLGTNVGINPQPLPPRVINAPGRINLGAEVGINPQPLPPRVITSPGRINLGTNVGINPQPLPPRI